MTTPRETWKGLASEQTLNELSAVIEASSGELKNVSATITRPANTDNYTAGDMIAQYASKAKQVSTITITGTGGLANITGTGGLTRMVTFNSTLDQTATDFVTAYAVDYHALDPKVVVTAGTASIIFTAHDYDTVFVPPVITNISDTLTGTVTHSTANRVAVKQKETITISGTAATRQKETVTITGVAAETQQETVTLQATPPTKMKVTIPLTGTLPVKQKDIITITGSSGTFTVTGTGGFTNIAVWNTDEDTTATDFVALYAAEYATAGVTVTANLHTIIFEAAVAGTPFVSPICSDGTADLHGAVSNDTANVAPGTANLTVVGLSPKLITFNTDLTTTAQDFVALWDTEYYLGNGIVLTENAGSLILETTTLGVPFGIPDVVTLTGNLAHGAIEQTVAHVAVGTATITAGATFSAVATYNTSIAQTCIDFDSAGNKASALANGIVLTHSGETLIFTAATKGTGFTSPNVTTLTGDLTDTSIVVDQANVPVGTANMTLAGGLTKLITYDTDAATTVSNFVDIGTNVADYAAVGITLTHSGNTIVMESTNLGFLFTAPVVGAAITGTCAGTVDHTVAGVVIGTGTITGIGASKLVTFDTDAATTVANFVSAPNIAYYVTLGVDLTNGGAGKIVFTAKVAGTGFTSPIFTNTAGDIAGALATTATDHYDNVTAVKQVETVLIEGTSGQLTVTATGGLSKVLTFVEYISDSITNFVNTNAALYLAQDVVLTKTATQLIFTAKTAGTAFAAPVLTNITDDLAGTVVSTPNISLLPLTLGSVAKVAGSGCIIKDIKLETDSTVFATKVVRLWLFNAVPAGVVGDNVAYANLIDDADKRNACPYVDITFDALLANSTVVIGKAHPDIEYLCSATSADLYVLLQSVDAVVTPKSGGIFKLSANVIR